MSALRTKLNAASFRTADVTVSLNGGLSMRRDELHAELAALMGQQREPGPDERLTAPIGARTVDDRLGQPTALEKTLKAISDLEEEMRDQLVTIRFTVLPTDNYESLKIGKPPRPGMVEDEYRGYNAHEMTKAVAVTSGKLVTGDTTEPIDESEWDDLWQVLTAGDFDRIKFTLVNLNETNGHAGVEFLKKGSGTTRNSATT